MKLRELFDIRDLTKILSLEMLLANFVSFLLFFRGYEICKIEDCSENGRISDPLFDIFGCRLESLTVFDAEIKSLKFWLSLTTYFDN